MATALLELAIDLPPKGSRAVQVSLCRQLKAAILDGRLKSGLRLPASRLLAKSLGLSRNTVVAVYDLLLNEGYLIARPGAGTYVAGDLARRPRTKPPSREGPADPRLTLYWRHFAPEAADVPRLDFDFRMGLPEIRFFPFPIWRRLTVRALRSMAKEGAAYGSPQGLGSLREAIARHISATRAVACEAQDIIVTTGSQQAFDLIARCLVEPGRTVIAMEEPGYPPVRAAFAAAGSDIRATPVDDEGLCVERLPKETRIIAVTPSHQFPLGVAMSIARRAALIDFARRHRAVIIEDDYDSEFRFSSRPLDALQTLDRDQSVFYVGTFSKCLFPAVRIGYLVAPPWARPALIAAKHMSDAHTSALTQETLSSFMSEGHLGRHVRRMRKLYGERRDVLSSALTHHFGDKLALIPAAAGLHLSARLRAPHRAHTLAMKAMEQGIGLQTFARYATMKAPANGLAFGYGMIETKRIDAAIARLRKLLV